MPAADRIGSVIAAKYRLDELLGEGGMGAVFKATHVTVGKRFAVKLLHAEVSKHPDAKRRFTQEAQAAARIGHPAILDVYDLGERRRRRSTWSWSCSPASRSPSASRAGLCRSARRSSTRSAC